MHLSWFNRSMLSLRIVFQNETYTTIANYGCNINTHLSLYRMLTLIFYFNLALPLKWIDLNLDPKSSANFLLAVSVSGTHPREGILKKATRGAKPPTVNRASVHCNFCVWPAHDPDWWLAKWWQHRPQFVSPLPPIPVPLVTDYNSHTLIQLMLKLSILPTQTLSLIKQRGQSMDSGTLIFGTRGMICFFKERYQPSTEIHFWQ